MINQLICISWVNTDIHSIYFTLFSFIFTLIYFCSILVFQLSCSLLAVVLATGLKLTETWTYWLMHDLLVCGVFPSTVISISALYVTDNFIFVLLSFQESVMLQFCGNKLDKKDFFGKSDPFLVFYRSNEDGSWVNHSFSPLLLDGNLLH